MTDKLWERYVSPRKRIAMGDPDPFANLGNFGVEPMSSHAAGGPAPAKHGKYLADHERAAKPPIDGNQANPDHGDY